MLPNAVDLEYCRCGANAMLGFPGMHWIKPPCAREADRRLVNKLHHMKDFSFKQRTVSHMIQSFFNTFKNRKDIVN